MPFPTIIYFFCIFGVVPAKTLHNLCLTDSCIKLAGSLLENLDTTVNPCEHFYQFACGGFAKKHISDQPLTRQLFNDKLFQVRIEDTLTNSLSSDPTETRIAQQYFTSCMNADLNKEWNDFVTKLKSIRTWPILEEKHFVSEDFNWIEWWTDGDESHAPLAYPFNEGEYVRVVVRKHYVDIQVPYVIEIKTHTHLPNINMIEIIQSFKLAHVIINDNELIREMSSVIQLAKSYRNLSKCNKQSIHNYVQLTVADLYDQVDENINWMQLINNQFAPVHKSIGLLHSIYVSNCSLQILRPIINLMNASNKRTIAIYMLLLILNEGKNSLLREYFHTKNLNWSAHKQQYRQNYCLQSTKDLFPLEITKLFEARYLQRQTKIILLDVATKMKNWVRSILAQWIDDDAFMLKYDRIKMPFEDRQQQSFLTNIERVSLFNTSYRANYALRLLQLSKIDQTRDNYSNNTFFTNDNISANTTIPTASQFASFGFLFAHQLFQSIHSFIMHDDDDSLPPVIISNQTIQRFKARTTCKTVNVSDLEAMNAAYQVYLKCQSEQDGQLPGLNFTENQLFWITASNHFCGINASAEKQRIVNIVTNSAEFAKDFNCVAGNAMNPKSKCIIWL